MSAQNRTLVEYFRNTILNNMQKVNDSIPEQRMLVYTAALKALKNVHEKNLSVSYENKAQQTDIIISIIQDIEQGYKVEKIKFNPVILLKRLETALFDSLDTSHLNKQTTPPTIKDSAQKTTRKKKQVDMKTITSKSLKLIAISLVCLLIGGLFILNRFIITGSYAVKTSNELPIEFIANESLLKFSRTGGKSKVYTSNDNTGGIIFEVDAEQPNTSTDKKLQELGRLHFIFYDDIANRLGQLNGEALIVFHLEKLTEEELEIDLVYRASGNPVVKKVNMIDNTLNEIFIFREQINDVILYPNAFFTIIVKQNPSQLNSNPKIRLKKIIVNNF